MWFSIRVDARPRGVTFTWRGCNSLCLWHRRTELAHSFFFFFKFCSRVYVCLYGPFKCISFHSTTPCFFTLFFRSYLCLIGPFIYTVQKKKKKRKKKKKKKRNAYLFAFELNCCSKIQLKIEFIIFRFATDLRSKCMILTLFSSKKKFSRSVSCDWGTRTSVRGMSFSSIDNCPASLRYGLDQVVNYLIWDGHPLLLECLKHLTHICKGVHSTPNMFLQLIVPSVFVCVSISSSSIP